MEFSMHWPDMASWPMGIYLIHWSILAVLAVGVLAFAGLALWAAYGAVARLIRRG